MTDIATVFWTVVPNGMTATAAGVRLRLSLVATLRPANEEGGDHSGSLLDDWPEWQRQKFADGVEFELSSSNGSETSPPLPGSQEEARGAACSTLWRNLIVKNASVVPVEQADKYAPVTRMIRPRKTARPIQSGMPITSFSVGNVADALNKIYGDALFNYRLTSTAKDRATLLLEFAAHRESLLTEQNDAHGQKLFVNESSDEFQLTNPDEAELAERNARRLSPDPQSLREPVLRSLRAMASTAPHVEAAPEIDQDFLKFRVFHGRVRGREPLAGAGAAADDATPPPPSDVVTRPEDLDAFDRIASAMNFHRLLRPLGLVTDWQVDLPATVWDADGRSKFDRIHLKTPKATARQGNPYTAITLLNETDHRVKETDHRCDGVFAAREQDERDDAPAQRARVRGFLPLGNANQYRLVQGDINGTAMKVVNWLSALLTRLPAMLPMTYVDSSLKLVEGELPKRMDDLAVQLKLKSADPPAATAPVAITSIESALPKVNDAVKAINAAVVNDANGERAEVWHSIDVLEDLPQDIVNKFGLPPECKPGAARACNGANANGAMVPVRLRLHILRDAAAVSKVSAPLYLVQFSSGSAYETNPSLEAPARQSMGFSIVDINRGDRIAKRLQRSNAASGVGSPSNPLWADDLILGYVPDVRIWTYNGLPSGEPRRLLVDWHSLTWRYETLLNTGFDAALDGEADGVVRPPVHQTTDTSTGKNSQTSSDLSVPETVFRWRGLPCGADQQSPLDDAMDRGVGDAATSDRFRVSLSVPAGTAVPLRFCERERSFEYEIRGRIYNIAGNAPAPCHQMQDSAFTVRDLYRREESILPPVVLLDRSLSDSFATSTLDRIVVGHGHRTEIRWLIPPRIAANLAEPYGLLDGPRLPGSFNAVDLEEDGNPPTVPFRPEVQDPQKQSGGDRLPIRRSPSGCEPTVPYWPDPFARRLHAELHIPGRLPIGPVIFDFTGGHNWPRWRAVAIVLERTDGPATLSVEHVNPEVPSDSGPRGIGHGHTTEPGQRKIFVRLPAGITGKLLIRCVHDDGDEFRRVMSVMTLPAVHSALQRLDEAKKNGSNLTSEQALMESVVPTLASPPHALEVAHAVLKPCKAPVLTIAKSGTNPAQAAGVFTVNLIVGGTVHGGSTGRLTLLANWCDANTTDIGDSKRSGRVEEWPIAAGLQQDTTCIAPRAIRHALPDGRRRLVSYSLEAASRFGHDFPGVPESEQLQIGDCITADFAFNGTVPPPRLSHLVPQWQRVHTLDPAGTHQTFTSQCKHVGFRLYFRDWYVTGYDEKIAIALRPVNPPPEEPKLKAYTVWGVDPLVPNPPPAPMPPPGTQSPWLDFDRAPQAGDFHRDHPDRYNVTVQTMDNDPMPADLGVTAPQEADLITYSPSWDSAQRLFYIDVSLQQTPSRGLMRLMLARYQENVLGDQQVPKQPWLCVSKILKLNFAQLFPERSVSVWRDPSNDRAMRWQIHTLSTETISPPTVPAETFKGARRTWFEVEVYAPIEDQWLPAHVDEIRVEPDPGVEDGRQGCITWLKQTGARKLLIIEIEAFHGQPDRRRSIYFDVLDV